MSRQITQGQQARQRLLEGVNIAGSVIGSTYGPKGRNVIIYRGLGDSPLSTRDGVTVARNVELPDPELDAGARVVREASEKTNREAGDGTTATAVLTQVIYSLGLKAIDGGASPVFLKRGIEIGVAVVSSYLESISVTVHGDKIEQIATISANNDPVLGAIITDAVRAAGKDGVITVDNSDTDETTLEKVEGMQLKTGYKSPYFITDPLRMEVQFENAKVLISEKKFSSFTPGIKTLLEKFATTQTPLFILAEDVEGDVIAVLVQNRMKAGRYWAAAKVPLGVGKGTLEDIAILCGGTALTADLGVGDDDIPVSMLGSAAKIVISDRLTTISGGGGTREAIQKRIAEIRVQLDKAEGQYEKDKLQERLARLSGGVSIIRVGASSEVELKDKKLKIEDALHATRAAVEDGIVAGGGVALARAALILNDLEASGDIKVGITIVQTALQEPLQRIVSNAGQDGDLVLLKVLGNPEPNFGFNALTDTYEDLMKAGVIDPTKVIRLALVNAASAAAQLLITEALITPVVEKTDNLKFGG